MRRICRNISGEEKGLFRLRNQMLNKYGEGKIKFSRNWKDVGSDDCRTEVNWYKVTRQSRGISRLGPQKPR